MWTSEQTMKFIDGLRSNPCLWDLTSLDYKNRNKKNDALATLGKEFGVDSHEVDKKIQSLKTQFRREHKKLLASKKSGCPIKSTWFGYESLLFLLQGNETKGFESPDIVQKEVS